LAIIVSDGEALWERAGGRGKDRKNRKLARGQSNMFKSVIVAMVALVAVSHSTPIERLATKGMYELLVLLRLFALALAAFTSDFVFFAPETESARVGENVSFLKMSGRQPPNSILPC
jgi:hypothetical protein